MKKIILILSFLICSCSIVDEPSGIYSVVDDISLANTLKDNLWLGLAYSAAGGFLIGLEFFESEKNLKYSVTSFSGNTDEKLLEMKIEDNILYTYNDESQSMDSFLRISTFSDDELEVYFYRDNSEIDTPMTLYRSTLEEETENIREILSKKTTWTAQDLNAYSVYVTFFEYNSHFSEQLDIIQDDIIVSLDTIPENDSANSDEENLDDYLEELNDDPFSYNMNSTYLIDYTYSIQLSYDFDLMEVAILILDGSEEILNTKTDFIIQGSSFEIYNSNNQLISLGEIVDLSETSFKLNNYSLEDIIFYSN